MNSREKEVIRSSLNDEQQALKNLKGIYKKSLQDINEKLAVLMQREADAAETTLQSIIYQKQYQQALKQQINGILDTLNGEQFNSISEYLTKSYEEAFYGTMYDIHGQGIPLIFPINQKQVVEALQTDSKISEGLYKRLGEDTNLLKKRIANNISRGIAQGSSYAVIAKNIAGGMIGYNEKNPGGALARALRITRTESTRIANKSRNDTQHIAKSKGADIVKQWDAALDKRTRDSHAKVDGELKQLDEKFSNGLLYPGDPNGIAAEVVNCRCSLLQRAKWALDDDELQTLKERAAYFGLDKTDSFEDFKKKYIKAVDKQQKVIYNSSKIIKNPKTTNDLKYNKLIEELARKNVNYNPILDSVTLKTQEKIIAELSGGDLTKGSCASLGLAYIGQRQGWDVLDFRDGESRKFFSNASNLMKFSEMKDISTIKETGASSITVGNRLLKHCEEGKEYYLCVGRHASIVRKNGSGKLQYLELQSRNKSGWTDFDGNPRYTLQYRFGCNSSSDHGASAYYDFMIDINDSDFNTEEFRSLLGYINTSVNEQRKGLNGTIK